jgi:hypothetical protein
LRALNHPDLSFEADCADENPISHLLAWKKDA